jgi:ubiquitin C-terminal hydrolase
VPDQRRWLFTSDSLVRPASIDEVLNTKHAYLLFYENVPADA